MEFVLLLTGDAGASTSAAELGSRTGALAEWVREQRDAGTVREGGHIEGPILRLRTLDGRRAVVDLSDDVGGDVRSWFLVDVADTERVVALAQSCPESRYGEVRILPIDPEGSLS